MSDASQPAVTVLVPCRNEERFIGACLDSILNNDYPKDRLEILVIDGMSQDETRASVSRYSHANHPSIQTPRQYSSRITPHVR
jgi:glycosyltransferase involved in cell wall biosynthesis